MSASIKNDALPSQKSIIFLHHSTGEVIWDAGVVDWFQEYNSKNNSDLDVAEQVFPEDSPYGWENYPYDYWNIWVNHAGDKPYKDEPTLESLTERYDVIAFKHCFPVSNVQEDTAPPRVDSPEKTVENYMLQYNALKDKMHEFNDTDFIVWTGAAQVKGATDSSEAKRAQTFFNWVKDEWDEEGDNIYIFDFYELETEGDLYMKNSFAESSDDAHPNERFARTVAPLFAQRIVDVADGYGDEKTVTGK
ncbi:hypothetical protein KKH43_00030 [Patescibacteria group bacterium]|nr:hypothetical protein [Patescibacteria group bacterium]